MEDEGTKEGRVISTANWALLQAAIEALQKLAKAGESPYVNEEKCMEEAQVPAMVMAAPVPKPLGGAMSWDDAEAWRAAQSMDNQAVDAWSNYDAIVRNIREADEDEMPRDQKLTAMQEAVAGLADKISGIKPEKKSLTEKVMDFFDFFTPGSREEEPPAEEEGEKVIRHEGDRWVLYTSNGSKKLGEFDTKEEALKRERQIQFFKHAGKEEDGEELEVGTKPYPNEHAARVRDPGDFEPNSFRSMELPKSKGGKGGVRTILGRLKGETTTTTQAYRFPADLYTAEEARQWLKDNDIKGASFEAAKKPEKESKDLIGSFKAYKGADGTWRWLTTTTNRFKDREGEIFSEEAHKEYVEYANAFKHYPELWLWHTPGSKLGQADFADYADGFVVHSGTFDKGKEAVAASLVAAKELAVSHGYKYRAADKEDGVYDWYRTFEVSVLPAARAANAWTDIVSKKEVDMPFSEEKKAFLVKHMGEEEVGSLEKNLASLSKQLEAAGVEFKDILDEIPKPEPEPEDEPEPEGGREPDASAQLQGISSKLEILTTQVGEIRGELVGFKERLDAAERSDDEKISEKMSPRRQAPGNGGGPATSEKTLVSSKEQKELEQQEKEDPIKPYVDDLTKGLVVGSGRAAVGE